MIHPDIRVMLNSGDLFPVLGCTPEDFRLEDVAHHLAMAPAFNGAAIGYYSLAQHAVYLSHIVPVGLRVAALLSSGVRMIMPQSFLHEGRVVQKVLEGKLAIGFDLPVTVFEHPDLTAMECYLSALEAKIMLRNPAPIFLAAGGNPDSTLYKIDPAFQFWPWDYAKKLWLLRYAEAKAEQA